MTVNRLLNTSTAWRHTLMAASCCLALATSAQAGSESSVRPLLGGGVTAGGDTVVNVTFLNEAGQSLDTSRVKAGQLLQVYGGLEYQPVSRFSLQATMGYHWHNTEGADGQAKFSRYPVELLGQFHINENWRVGAGARFVRRAKLELNSSNAANTGSAVFNFGNTTGTILEGEYVVDRKLGLKLRYVSEKYDAPTPFPSKVDGSHLGFLVNWYLGSTD